MGQTGSLANGLIKTENSVVNLSFQLGVETRANGNLTINFNRPVDPSTVNSDLVTIIRVEKNAQPVNFPLTLKADGYDVKVIPENS
ncbi:MAG: hypothetical protein AAGU27_23860, partial [Dehalobacterium sp.]